MHRAWQGVAPLLTPALPPFTGETGILPENRVNRSIGLNRLVPLRNRTDPWEGTMSARRVFGSIVKSLIGFGFLAGGATLIVAEFWSMTLRFSNLLNPPAADSLEVWTRFGLASLRALQLFAFNPSMLFSLGYGFLVSFTALGIALIGLALLHNQLARHRAR